MAGAHAVDVELFHQEHVFADRFHIHRVAQIGVLHVAVYAVQLHRHAVKVKNLVPDFHFLKANSFGQSFRSFS